MNIILVVPTTIHLPDELLAEVDERARALRMSRSRYITRALRRLLAEETEWSAGFFEQLADQAEDVADDVREMMEAIKGARSSKEPPELG